MVLPLLSSPLPTINALKQPTSDASWVEQAIANLDITLLDHSHCERKGVNSDCTGITRTL